MSLLEVFKTTMIASVWLSWIGVLIACLPAGFAFAIAPTKRRWQYFVPGLLGGVAGEFCGVGSLFLSLWFSCLGKGPSCNTAQGDMGLMITVPTGAFLGSLLALFWTWATLRIPPESPWSSVWCYSGPSRILNWTYAIAIQIAFWVLVTWSFARLMA
jgi:hypothetical protein